MFFAILSTISGQLGPNYDPLFYDVTFYIAGGIIFLIIMIIVIVLVVSAKSKKINNKQHVDALDDSSDDNIDDSLDKEKWDGI